MDMTVGRPVGTLVSVNVGLPREVAWRGRTVYTGVWKEPVEGPRTVRRLNVDGEVGIGDRYRIGTARPRPVILAATRRRAASLVCLAPYFAGGVEWPRVMASGVGWGRCGGGSGVGFVA